MAFLMVHEDGADAPCLVNTDYVVKVLPYELRDDGGVVLWMAQGGTMVIKGDMRTIAIKLEAKLAQGT